MIMMDSIKQFLKRTEVSLQEEADNSLVYFPKKAELFGMLRAGQPLEQILELIQKKVGTKLQPWHQDKFTAIHSALSAMRQAAFEQFVRKSHLNQLSLADRDLKVLEQLIYQGDECGIHTLVLKLVKKSGGCRLARMAIEWSQGKDIVQQGEQSQAPAAEQLRSHIDFVVERFHMSAEERQACFESAMKKDWPAIAKVIEMYEPDSKLWASSIERMHSEVFGTEEEPTAQSNNRAMRMLSAAHLSEKVPSRKFYVALAYKSATAKPASRELFVINGSEQYSCRVINHFDNCYFYEFTIVQMAEYIQLQSHSGEQSQRSHPIPTAAFSTQTNYLLEVVFYQRDNSDIVRLSPFEELCLCSLMITSDAQLLLLSSYLQQRHSYLNRLKEHLSMQLEQETMNLLKQSQEKPQRFYFYYIAATVYELVYASQPPLSAIYGTVKLFLECKNHRNGHLRKELLELDARFRRVLLRIHFQYGKGRLQEALLDSFLNSPCQKGTSTLVELLHKDINLSPTERKLTRIPPQRLMELTKKLNIPPLQHLNLMIVGMAYTAVTKRTNSMGLFISILHLVGSRTAEWNITEPLDPRSEEMLQAIHKNCQTACSINFALDTPTDECAKRVFSVLAPLPSKVARSITNHALKRVLQLFIIQVTVKPTIGCVELAYLAFIQPTSPVVAWQLYSKFIRDFFSQTIKVKVKGGFLGLSEKEQSHTKYLQVSQEILIEFASQILYPLHLRQGAQYHKQTIDLFVCSLELNAKPLPEKIKILNRGLKNSHLPTGDDQTIYRSLDPCFKRIFDTLEKSPTFSWSNLAESKDWLEFLQLEKPLKRHLIVCLSNNSAKWKSAGSRKHLSQTMIDDILNNRSICKQDKMDSIVMLAHLEDPNSITIEGMRTVFTGHPLRAKLYATVMRRDKQEAKNQVRTFSRQLRYQAEKGLKLQRRHLKELLALPADAMQDLDLMFDLPENKERMSAILHRLERTCQQTLLELERVNKLSQFFNGKSIGQSIQQQTAEIIASLQQGTLDALFRADKFRELWMLDPAIHQLYSLKLFEGAVLVSEKSTIQQFAESLRKCLEILTKKVVKLLQKFRNGALTVSDVDMLAAKTGSPEQLHSALMTFQKSQNEMARATNDQLEALVAIMSYKFQLPTKCRQYLSLKYLCDLAKQQMEVNHQLFQKLLKMEFEAVLANDFRQAFSQFDELRMRVVSDQDQHLLYIIECASKCDNPLKQFAAIETAEVEQLKRSAKNNPKLALATNQLEHIHRFSLVLANTKSVEDCITELKAFLIEEERVRKPSIRELLERMKGAQSRLRSVVTEAPAHQASFADLLASMDSIF